MNLEPCIFDRQRNLAEYEGHLELDDTLLDDLLRAADWLLDEVQQLSAP